MEATYRKVFVEVIVKHANDGQKTPLSLTFENGKKYEIDRVRSRKRAACTKVGGGGLRYTIQINGRETYLFEDEDKFWVEAKNLHT